MAKWVETVDLRDVWNHTDPWQTVRRGILPRLEKSIFYKNSLYVRGIVEDLRAAETADEFDDYWHELYNEADLHRVWIELF